MAESYRPVHEILETAARMRGKELNAAPVLGFAGSPQISSENRSGATTDQQIFRLWLDSKRSEHTRRSYARDIQIFNAFLVRTSDVPLGLGDVTVRHVESFREDLERSGVPPRTASRRLSAVKSLLTFAQQTGYLHFNVGTVVKLPAFEHDLADRILSESEVSALIYAAPEGRSRVLVRFLYYTGCRVAEAVRVRFEHLSVHGERFVVRLFGKGSRTRYVPIPLEIRRTLELLKKSNMSGFVFETRGGKAMHPKDVWRTVRNAAKHSGIAHKASPHCLRHSHASHAIRRGADVHVVQQTLGHTSIRTTGDYLHLERGDSSAMYLNEDLRGPVDEQD